MGFPAPSLLVIILSTVACVSLSRIDCGASKLSLLQIRQPSLLLYTGRPTLENQAAGRRKKTILGSRLRGGAAQEEAADLLQALHQLEREIQGNPRQSEREIEGNPRQSEREIHDSPQSEREIHDSPQSGKEMLDEIEEEEEEEERHPADALLQRHHADATISYILGGY